MGLITWATDNFDLAPPAEGGRIIGIPLPEDEGGRRDPEGGRIIGIS